MGLLTIIEKKIKTEQQIIEAMHCTANLAKKYGFPTTMILKLQLVTEEACTNALEYCQHQNISFFKVKWKVKSNRFELSVKQKGGEFTLAQQEEVNTGIRGRGLFLIQQFVDLVEIRKDKEDVELLIIKENGV